MKILHTADWHLGKKLNDFSRIEEQKAVLEEIIAIAEREQPDAILIAGDLFDTANPPVEAIELFYRTVKRLANDGKCAVVAIAGNHDQPERIDAPDPLAAECGIFFAGFPEKQLKPIVTSGGVAITRSDTGFIELKLPNTDIALRLLLMPYANEIRLKKYLVKEQAEQEMRSILAAHWQKLADKYCDEKGVNMLIAHLFVIKRGEKQIEKEPDDERHILREEGSVGGAQMIFTENIPSAIQYTALGHLHRQHFVGGHQGKVAYSGSLLEYSFAEAQQQKYVVLVDALPNEPITTKNIPLTAGLPLERKRFESIATALQWLYANQNCYVEFTLVTDSYITAQEKKQLYEAHPRIVAIYPENSTDSGETEKQAIDLTKDITTLFKEYFKNKTRKEPSEEIIQLFEECRQSME
jgi:exonuclease SbcD